MPSNNTEYQTVIGLEVHIQLNTQSKAFSGEVNRFDLSPNTNISAISLALPGTLPRANKEHLLKAIKLGLALGCIIPAHIHFDRKNYFYPDLPKGYQITQDKNPVGRGGSWTFKSGGANRSIRIHHIHMEEDAGKSNHDQHPKYSLIEYNRAGTPLVELVTEPDFRSGQEVYDFLTSLQQLVQYLDISDGNMEEGSIRCDCNVSIMPIDSDQLGERCEIKNVNSRRFAREAIQYEAGRQRELIKSGVSIQRTTLLYDSEKGITLPMRKKEGENDYRYFPEPDIAPIEISHTMVDEIKKSLGVLPHEAYQSLTSLGLTEEDAEKICQKKTWFVHFINLHKHYDLNPEVLAILMVNRLIPFAEANNRDLSTVLSERQVVELTELYQSGQVGKSQILSVLVPALLDQPEGNARELASRLNLIISSDDGAMKEWIRAVISENPEKVKEYRKGKKGLLGFFMGQVKMKSDKALDALRLKTEMETALDQTDV